MGKARDGAKGESEGDLKSRVARKWSRSVLVMMSRFDGSGK